MDNKKEIIEKLKSKLTHRSHFSVLRVADYEYFVSLLALVFGNLRFYGDYKYAVYLETTRSPFNLIIWPDADLTMFHVDFRRICYEINKSEKLTRDNKTS